MSNRPRLAGEGRLLVPDKVIYDQDDFVHVRLSDDLTDPFEWTSDRLLLAEAFTRTDLRDKRATRTWIGQHGTVDRLGVVGRVDNTLDFLGKPEPPSHEIWEHVADIEVEQENVAWHLRTLERLSRTRDDQRWQREWGHLIVGSPSGDVIVGGPDAGGKRMSRYAVDLLRRQPDLPEEVRGTLDEQVRLHSTTEGWPTVAVGQHAWLGHWVDLTSADDAGVPDNVRSEAAVLGSSWDGAVELERRLLASYVVAALDRRVPIVREIRDTASGERSALGAREERVWRSILLPIYLQLYEALCRITEGEPGAATCRECDRPFLVLDARRRYFCNGRERTRHTQRERRRRLGGEDLEAGG